MAGPIVSMKSVTTAVCTHRQGCGGGQVAKLGLLSKGRGGGWGLVECWFPVISFELNRDWVSPASKSLYDWKIVKAT